MTENSSIDKFAQWYEQQPWLRALAQLPPGGGSVDVLLAHRATQINQKRLEDLIRSVSEALSAVEEEKLDKQFLNSEEFFDFFRRCAEIAAHTASFEKRQLIAKYLAGTAKASLITDLMNQMLEDINVLQPLHLQIIAALPSQVGVGVGTSSPPNALGGMPTGVYQKGIADLERMGFIRFNNEMIGTIGGGGGGWDTTEYLCQFKETFSP